MRDPAPTDPPLPKRVFSHPNSFLLSPPPTPQSWRAGGAAPPPRRAGERAGRSRAGASVADTWGGSRRRRRRGWACEWVCRWVEEAKCGHIGVYISSHCIWGQDWIGAVPRPGAPSVTDNEHKYQRAWAAALRLPLSSASQRLFLSSPGSARWYGPRDVTHCLQINPSRQDSGSRGS
jgi:hypothetical protein